MHRLIFPLVFSCFLVTGCGGDEEASRGLLVDERRFYNADDEELIHRARASAASLINEPRADLLEGWTPVVLRMEKLDCVKFDLDPPGIGKDVSICFNREDGMIYDHSPVDTSGAH